MSEVSLFEGHHISAIVHCQAGQRTSLLLRALDFCLTKGVHGCSKFAVHIAGLIGVFLALTVPTILSNSS